MPVCHSECHCSYLDFHSKLSYVALPWDLKFCKAQHSELRPFVMAHFDATVLTIHCETTWIPSWLPPLVPLCVWHSTQCSSLFSISEVGCFCVSWNETLLQSFISLYASIKCLVSYQKTNFHAFYAFWGPFNFYFWSIQSSWNQIGILRWKLIHVHLACTLQSFLTCKKFSSFCIIFAMTRFYCSFMDICSYKLVSVCIIISESLLVLL